jgi:hypothetical protein
MRENTEKKVIFQIKKCLSCHAIDSHKQATFFTIYFSIHTLTFDEGRFEVNSWKLLSNLSSIFTSPNVSSLLIYSAFIKYNLTDSENPSRQQDLFLLRNSRFNCFTFTILWMYMLVCYSYMLLLLWQYKWKVKLFAVTYTNSFT